MTSHDCEHFRGLIALSAIGALPESERAALGAHLDGCRECRHEELELRELSSLLPLADLGRLDEEEMPRGLPGAVLGRLRAEARRERRTRAIRYSVSGAAAAAIVALSLALSLGGGSGGAGARTFALTGERGVHATVQLTAKAWGTSVQVDQSAQITAEVLTVSMRTKSGVWWEAGTYRTVPGRAVQVDLACALGLGDIRSVWVKTSNGHVVLHAYVS